MYEHRRTPQKLKIWVRTKNRYMLYEPLAWQYTRRTTYVFAQYFFTARHYASTVLAIVLCPSVRHTPVLYQNY